MQSWTKIVVAIALALAMALAVVYWMPEGATQELGKNPPTISPVAQCNTDGKRSLRKVPLHAQDASEWCWAASAQMIMEYENKGAAYYQCKQADKVNSSVGLSTDCCSNPDSSDCNTPGSPPFALYDFNSIPTSLGMWIDPWDALATQICKGQPIAASWRYPGRSAGHMMVVNGYTVVHGMGRGTGAKPFSERLVELINPCDYSVLGDDGRLHCVYQDKIFKNYDTEFKEDTRNFPQQYTHGRDYYEIYPLFSTISPP